MQFESLLDSMPLIAILRGLTPERAVEVSQAVFAAGIRVIEVPLNSPHAYASIAKLRNLFGDTCLCGAGTVISAFEVKRIHDVGGRLIVSPNFDAEVVEHALALGMVVMPGIATATEAFSAIHAGAQRLKLFPAATYGSRHLKALKDVLPGHIRVYPVGGIGATEIDEWKTAGADGFGFGSEVFRPTYRLEEISVRTQRVVEVFRNSTG